MHFSGKRLLLLGIILVLLAAIPLTLYLMSRQSDTRSRATKSTTLSLVSSPEGTTSNQASPIAKNVNDAFSLDVSINPGSNEVIHTTLSINYDPTKLTFIDFQPTAALPSILEGPTNTNGNALLVISTGADITKAIKTQTKIATISFKATASTGSTPVQVSFGDQTTVTSTMTAADQADVNVLSTSVPAWIAVGGTGGTTPTPTLVSTNTTPTPTTPTATATQNQPPTCTALNVDRVTSGSAPFSITFTANGSDTDGTVSKVTYDFGDGPVQNIVADGGIGTKTVSVQVAHTYRNAGTFKATSVLTDNSGAVSNPTTCAQTITVSAAATPTTGETIAATSTPIPTATPIIVQATLPPSGPGDKIIGAGIAGAIVTAVGVLLFLAL